MNKKTLVVSLLTIAMCLALIAGSTFALFTSDDEVNIVVSSGKVEVKAVIRDLVYDSVFGETLVGSSAVLSEEEQLLTLTNIVPGDYVTFNIVITNNSNVAINYRTVIQMLNDNGLWSGLKVTVGKDANGEGIEYDGTLIYADWAELQPESEDIVIPVKISLPKDAGNEYQEKSCQINYRVEAIQGNAPVVNPYTVENGVYYINSEEGMMLMNQIINTVPHSEGSSLNFVLTADMDMTGCAWTPLYAHWVNVDGQGHKISNLNCGTDSVGKSGFAGYLGAATIKNITLENVTVAGEQAGVVAGQVEACTLENITIAGTNTVSYADVEYNEEWSGVGAVIGVDVSGNTDKTGITIAQGATIAVNYAGCKTKLAGPANELAFNLAINVTNNGTVTTNSFAICLENGFEMVYEDGEKTLYSVPADYAAETVVVPEGVTTIGRYSFNQAKNVKKVELASTVKVIDDYAFSQTGITEFVLNEGLEEIGNRAFQKTMGLTSIVLPETLEIIEAYAFQGTGLTSITVPASVETIAQGAFAYNSALETIIIKGSPELGDGTGEKNSNVNYVARACANLKSVYIFGNPTYATKGITFSNAESGVANKITVYADNQAAIDAYKAATSYIDCKFVLLNSDSEGLFKTEDGNYVITAPAGLLSINSMIANNVDFINKTISLAQDIDMNGATWNTISRAHFEFGTKLAGMTFDGNGHTISNMNISGSGLFDIFAMNGTVTFKNLTMDNITSNEEPVYGGNQFKGVFVGNLYSDMVFDNVTVSNSQIGGYWAIGAFVGIAGNENVVSVNFKNCKVENFTIDAPWNYYNAAFVGCLGDNSNITFTGANAVINFTVNAHDGAGNNTGGAIHTDVSEMENVTVDGYVVNFK